VGRLTSAYTGTEANASWGNPDGPYAQSHTYDVWGNITSRAGWGGENASYSATFNSNNRMVTNPINNQPFSYDAAGKGKIGPPAFQPTAGPFLPSYACSS
jgi:hypothetical protein